MESESRFTDEDSAPDSPDDSSSHASTPRRRSSSPAVPTQRMMEEENERREDLLLQQQSNTAHSNAVASSSAGLGLYTLFHDPHDQSHPFPRSNRAQNQKKRNLRSAQHTGNAVPAPLPIPESMDIDPSDVVAESGAAAVPDDRPPEEMTDSGLRRAALVKLSSATDNALAKNIALQAAVLETMKKLDAAAKRATEMAKSAGTAHEVITAQTPLTHAIPGAPPPAIPWFKHHFGKELPPNADGIARDLYLSTIRFRPWTKAEQNSLKKEIIFHNNRMIAMEATEMGEDINVALARYPESFFVESTEFLDWEKISSVMTKRTAGECRIQWLQNDHPTINRHKWTHGELNRLYELFDAEETPDWTQIAHELGTGRATGDCARHVARRSLPRSDWTSEQDALLREGVKIYGETWQSVALHVGKTTGQCIHRWSKSVRPNIARGKWSKEEDAQLILGVETVGPTWILVAPFVGQRTDAQCRERWFNVVNPVLLPYSVWSPEEDSKLLQLKAGGMSWSQMQIQFENRRTDNHCKGRHAELLKLAAGTSRTQQPRRPPRNLRPAAVKKVPKPSSKNNPHAAGTVASTSQLKPYKPKKPTGTRNLSKAQMRAARQKYDAEGNPLPIKEKRRTFARSWLSSKLSTWAGPLLELPPLPPGIVLPPNFPSSHGQGVASGSGPTFEAQEPIRFLQPGLSLSQPAPTFSRFVAYIPPGQPGHHEMWKNDPPEYRTPTIRINSIAHLRDAPRQPTTLSESFIGPRPAPKRIRLKPQTLKELEEFGPRKRRVAKARAGKPKWRFAPVDGSALNDVARVRVRRFIPVTFTKDGEFTADFDGIARAEEKNAELQVKLAKRQARRALQYPPKRRKEGFADRRGESTPLPRPLKKVSILPHSVRLLPDTPAAPYRIPSTSKLIPTAPGLSPFRPAGLPFPFVPPVVPIIAPIASTSAAAHTSNSTKSKPAPKPKPKARRRPPPSRTPLLPVDSSSTTGPVASTSATVSHSPASIQSASTSQLLPPSSAYELPISTPFVRPARPPIFAHPPPPETTTTGIPKQTAKRKSLKRPHPAPASTLIAATPSSGAPTGSRQRTVNSSPAKKQKVNFDLIIDVPSTRKRTPRPSRTPFSSTGFDGGIEGVGGASLRNGVSDNISRSGEGGAGCAGGDVEMMDGTVRGGEVSGRGGGSKGVNQGSMEASGSGIRRG